MMKATKRLALAVVVAAGLLEMRTRVASAAPAPDANSVLILADTVVGGSTSLEAITAAGLGFTVDVATAADWAAKSTADFATYKAIILGDPICGNVASLAAAAANTAVWGPAVTGNVILIGTDPTYHTDNGNNSAGADKLVNTGIGYSAADPGRTGAYIALSCYYGGAPAGTPVPVLNAFSVGGFTVDGEADRLCFNDTHIVATHPALTGLTDADLSNWSCSVHETFDTWPNTFLVLAIAENLGAAFHASDGVVGTPYILARGTDLRPITRGAAAPTLSAGAIAFLATGMFMMGLRSLRKAASRR